MEILVGKEEVKDWLFFYTIHTNPPPEPVPQLFSVPSELVLSAPEHLFSDFRYKPDFSEAFCCVDLRFGYLAWALSALVDFLEVEMVESQFFQR